MENYYLKIYFNEKVINKKSTNAYNKWLSTHSGACESNIHKKGY